MIRSGRLDTLVTILEKVANPDSVYLTEDPHWLPLADGEEWAEVQDFLPSRAERVEGVADIGRRPARVRMRYRDDVTQAMRLRIEDDGRILQIVSGPAELGRREGIELIAEELTTQGDAA